MGKPGATRAGFAGCGILHFWLPLMDEHSCADCQLLHVRLGNTFGAHCARCRAYLAGGRGGLGEPSSVAHSAMLLLALAVWEDHPSESARRRLMNELAAGILHQQRPDGSLRIYFEPGGPGLHDNDPGWQLYGGEAAYALGAVYSRLRDDRLLRGTAAALHEFQAKYRQVDEEQKGMPALNLMCDMKVE